MKNEKRRGKNTQTASKKNKNNSTSERERRREGKFEIQKCFSCDERRERKISTSEFAKVLFVHYFRLLFGASKKSGSSSAA
jgi:hypothetical protein